MLVRYLNIYIKVNIKEFICSLRSYINKKILRMFSESSYPSSKRTRRLPGRIGKDEGEDRIPAIAIPEESERSRRHADRIRSHQR